MVPRRLYNSDFRIGVIALRPVNDDFRRITGRKGYADRRADQQLGGTAENLFRRWIGRPAGRPPA